MAEKDKKEKKEVSITSIGLHVAVSKTGHIRRVWWSRILHWIGIVTPKLIIGVCGIFVVWLIFSASNVQGKSVDFGFTVPGPLVWLMACQATFAFPVALQFFCGALVALITRGASDLALLKPRGTAHDLAYHLLAVVCLSIAAGNVLAVVYPPAKSARNCEGLGWLETAACYLGKLVDKGKRLVNEILIVWPDNKQAIFRRAAHLTFPQILFGHLVHAVWNFYLLRKPIFHVTKTVIQGVHSPTWLQGWSSFTTVQRWESIFYTVLRWFAFCLPKLIISGFAIAALVNMADATEYISPLGVDFGFIVFKSVAALITVIFTFSIPTGLQLIYGILTGQPEEILPQTRDRVRAGHESLFHLTAVASYVSCFVLVWYDIWETGSLYLGLFPFSIRKREKYVISAFCGLYACLGHGIHFFIAIHYMLPGFYEWTGIFRLGRSIRRQFYRLESCLLRMCEQWQAKLCKAGKSSRTDNDTTIEGPPSYRQTRYASRSSRSS